MRHVSQSPRPVTSPVTPPVTVTDRTMTAIDRATLAPSWRSLYEPPRSFRRQRDCEDGLVNPEVPPADRALEGAADDVVDLPRGAGAQRAAGVARASPAGAKLAAAVQPGVEALEELGIELHCRQVAERRHHVEPDEVVVTLAGRVLVLGQVKPDRLTNGELRLRVGVLVHIALKLGKGDLSPARSCSRSG